MIAMSARSRRSAAALSLPGVGALGMGALGMGALGMGALGAVVLAVAGCASAPETLPPAVVPKGASAPPPVALSARALEAASAYRGYMRRAAAIAPDFRTGDAVEESLTRGEAFEPQQLSRGLVAYAALIALQDPQFVASVRTYAVDPDQRRDIASRIAADPGYVAVLPNAASAAGLVIATLDAEGARVREAGELVKHSAYDVQHQKWSSRPVADAPGRLARAKSLSAVPMTAEPSDVAELAAAVAGPDPKVAPRILLVSGQSSAPPFTPLVNRALAVAALAALGQGADDDAEVDALLNENAGGFCLNMTKLNLYQCLAVAKPYYEDIFCLGQHAMIDTGQCVEKGAGSVRAAAASAAPPAPAAP